MACIPLALALFNSEAILKSLGQDLKVVEHTTEFLDLAGPGVILDMIACTYAKWLIQFRLQHVPMLTSWFSFLVFVPCAYLLSV